MFSQSPATACSRLISDSAGSRGSRCIFFSNLRVFIKASPQQELEQTLKSKDTQCKLALGQGGVFHHSIIVVLSAKSIFSRRGEAPFYVTSRSSGFELRLIIVFRFFVCIFFMFSQFFIFWFAQYCLSKIPLLCMGESDKAPTNKIYRRASSEQRPRTRSCHESERLV